MAHVQQNTRKVDVNVVLLTAVRVQWLASVGHFSRLNLRQLHTILRPHTSIQIMYVYMYVHIYLCLYYVCMYLCISVCIYYVCIYY